MKLKLGVLSGDPLRPGRFRGPEGEVGFEDPLGGVDCEDDRLSVEGLFDHTGKKA